MWSKIKEIWWSFIILCWLRKVIFWKVCCAINPSIRNSVRYQQEVANFVSILENEDEIADETVNFARQKLLDW